MVAQPDKNLQIESKKGCSSFVKIRFAFLKMGNSENLFKRKCGSRSSDKLSNYVRFFFLNYNFVSAIDGCAKTRCCVCTC